MSKPVKREDALAWIEAIVETLEIIDPDGEETLKLRKELEEMKEEENNE